MNTVELKNGNLLFEDGTIFKRSVDQENSKDPMKVIIEPNILNADDIVEAQSGYKAKKFIYRPETLTEYIGQQNAKNLINLNLKKIRKIKPVHFLIHGQRGHGKSTLAYIIKNTLKATMIERIANQIQGPDQIIELVNEINRSEAEHVILFIDEIHSLNPALCEVLYPVIEDFKISGKNVKPFILIGATTEKHILLKNNAPFVNRFQVDVALERYKSEDIVIILQQYKEQLYKEFDIPESFIKTVAENAKLTPRIAISLLEDGIIEPDVNVVLKCHRIVHKGLTEVDVNILRILSENTKPVGSKALSQMTGINERDYLEGNEAYMVEQELIIRSPRGRVISDKGKDLYVKISSRM